MVPMYQGYTISSSDGYSAYRANSSRQGTNKGISLILFVIFIACLVALVIESIVPIILLLTVPIFYCLFVTVRKEYRKFKARQTTRTAIRRADNVRHRKTTREPTTELNQPTVASIVDETININPQIEEPPNEVSVSVSSPTMTLADVSSSAEDLPPAPKESVQNINPMED